MCPDKNLLSAYFDGELDGKFQSDLEAHIAECDSCKEILTGLEELRACLIEDTEHDAYLDKAAAWRLLQKRVAYAVPSPVWRRKIPIPAPLLAAVTLLLIMLSVGLIYSVSSQRGYSAFDSVTRINLEGSELTSVEAILGYLEARGEGKALTFNLPNDTQLQFWSEPTLIRAADYQRGRD